MGRFQITIRGIGSHGVDREKRNKEVVDFNVDGPSTPDAIAKKCVDELKASGANVEEATITHWPGQDPSITDNLQTGVRSGSFE